MTTEALTKRYCNLSISKKWAAHRQTLWDDMYDPSKTKDEIISNKPDGVDSIQWAMFVNYRLNPETQERCRKNKENRRKQVIPHTGGSKPLSIKRHEMKPSRGKVYIETHKKKDGSIINDAAKAIVEQIEVGLAKNNVDESVISPNDVVGRVLGPEHPGRVRCMGMAATPTNTFTSNGVRLSHLSNSLNVAYTSSNFWQGKYTNLEAAFKAYLMMKEGGIPREVADILGLSNVDQGKNNKGTNVNAPVISDEDISDEEETPVQKGKNNKRPNEAGSQTPLSAKKDKNAFPRKTGRVITHTHIHTSIQYIATASCNGSYSLP
ncbi:hypothetical protein TSUD_351930 [Trifolium subterraneum]|nr:hypothetical protein TSUD_351930 [Trifolium subterraneum]